MRAQKSYFLLYLFVSAHWVLPAAIAQGEIAFESSRPKAGSQTTIGGVVYFDTHASNGPDHVDARVVYADGTPVGPGFTAQLYGGPAGTPAIELQPVFPSSPLWGEGPEAGYTMVPARVGIPGVEPGRAATLFMN